MILKVLAGRSYRFVSRPAGIVVHGHPVLVFDSRARVHLPLTTIAREATRRLSASSVRVYLYALLPYFTFLDSRGPGGEQNSWTGDFQVVRHAVGAAHHGGGGLGVGASDPSSPPAWSWPTLERLPCQCRAVIRVLLGAAGGGHQRVSDGVVDRFCRRTLLRQLTQQPQRQRLVLIGDRAPHAREELTLSLLVLAS